MRNFGAICVVVGVVGYFYCADEMSKVDPLPEGLSISQSLEHPAGKWQVGEYGAAFVGAMGALLALYPSGR